MSAKTVKKIKLSSKAGKKTEVTTNPTKKTDKKTVSKKSKISFNPITASWRYVKNSWQELKKVHWPNRRSSWGLTAAVIAYTVVLGLVILLLDSVFQWFFKDFIFK